MTEVAQLKNLIERGWEPSIFDRATDVPDPANDEITWTLEKSERTADLRNRDVGYITSGADTAHIPQGLGWNHEQIQTAVVIEYRTRTRTASSYDNGYHRLFGKPTGPDGVEPADRWDGITGETRRVLGDNRKRTGGWDLVGADTAGGAIEVRDLTDLGGSNYYRADVFIPLETIAHEIETFVTTTGATYGGDSGGTYGSATGFTYGGGD